MRHPLLRGIAAALLLLTAVAAPAVAKETAADPDLKTLESYRLTGGGLEKFMSANRNMMKAVEANPQLKAQMEEEEESADATGFSIDRVAAEFDRHAPIKKAIADAGLSTREFATITLVLFQVGMADWGMSQGGKLPEGVSQANLETYRAHKAAIEQFSAEMQAAEERSAPRNAD